MTFGHVTLLDASVSIDASSNRSHTHELSQACPMRIIGAGYAQYAQKTHMYKVSNANRRVDIKDLLQLLANADLHRYKTSNFLSCKRASQIRQRPAVQGEHFDMKGAAPATSCCKLTRATHKLTCAASLLADLVQMHSLSCFALTLTTTPQISSPSVNCSPMHASSCSADAHNPQSCYAVSDLFQEGPEVCFRCACAITVCHAKFLLPRQGEKAMLPLTALSQ